MDADKFVWLISPEDEQITVKLARFLKNATRIRNYELETQNLHKNQRKQRNLGVKINEANCNCNVIIWSRKMGHCFTYQFFFSTFWLLSA